MIVQGRYVLLCPPTASHALAERRPEAELRLVEAAGHALSEPDVGKAVLAAIEDFKKRLS